MAAPTSQKANARPISFVLQAPGASNSTVTLVIRPEDLTRSEPSLLTPVQTFDGAWIDDFGRGISSIQISGHTGWRGGQNEDGVQGFIALRDTVFVEWHALRAQQVTQGKDPDGVKLIFVDTLDDICAVVAPGNFTLKRSKSRPLLMMYQLGLTVLNDSIQDPTPDPLSVSNGAQVGPQPDLLTSGSKSLTASLSTLNSSISQLPSLVNSAVVRPLTSFMTLTNTGISKVLAAVNPVTGLVDNTTHQLVSVITDLTQVGRNAIWSYMAVEQLAVAQEVQLASVAAAFENSLCVLRNAFALAKMFPDFSDIYGASGCSSTVGGSPLSALAGQNPFNVYLPVSSPAISVSPSAALNIGVLKSTDPVLSPLASGDVASRLGAITAGVMLS